ncbi:MAG: polyprenyl synthetase family protein [Patescibacteria group bacterium]
MDLKIFKQEFDPILIDFIEKKRKKLKIYKNQDLIHNLSHLTKLLESGKRIRPYLSFLSYKAYGGTENKAVIELLIFLEIFHMFCLVHDDIMDKSGYRHNVKTMQEFAKSNITFSSDKTHYGESIAILVGDFLLAWAFEILLKNKKFKNEIEERIRNIFFKLIEEVIIGQFLDVNTSSRNDVSQAEIFQKTTLKTAGYSFAWPMIIGASLVKDVEQDKFLNKFGLYLGMAFQIQDDLFDIIYDGTQLKKSSFNDMEQHQHTIFTNYILDKGRKDQREIIKEHWGKKINFNDKVMLRKVFKESGAIEYGKSLIEVNLKKAKSILKEASLPKEYNKTFLDFIDLISRRSY